LNAGAAFSVIFPSFYGVVRTNKDWWIMRRNMARNRIFSGLLIAAGLVCLAALGGAGQTLAPGARADDQKPPHRQRHARRARPRAYAVERGSTPAEIARYFALYGGYIDPAINKQSPGGPFDSGFFFDSGIGPNGGDSPYMN
jgi:hypothetical protein